MIYFVPNSNCIIYARHHEDNLSKDTVIKAIYVPLDICCEAYKDVNRQSLLIILLVNQIRLRIVVNSFRYNKVFYFTYFYN